MLMESPAGDMEIEFVKVVKKGDKLVILAKTGVWESQIHVDRNDFFNITKRFLTRAAVSFAIESLFKGLADRLARAESKSEGK